MLQVRSSILKQLLHEFESIDSILSSKLDHFKFLMSTFDAIAAKSAGGQLSSENSSKAVVIDKELRDMFVPFFLTTKALGILSLKELVIASMVMLSGRPQATSWIDSSKIDP